MTVTKILRRKKIVLILNNESRGREWRKGKWKSKREQLRVCVCVCVCLWERKGERKIGKGDEKRKKLQN